MRIIRSSNINGEPFRVWPLDDSSRTEQEGGIVHILETDESYVQLSIIILRKTAEKQYQLTYLSVITLKSEIEVSYPEDVIKLGVKVWT